jgi:hypothetical protein
MGHRISCVISNVHVNIIADNVDNLIRASMLEHVDELLCERDQRRQEERVNKKQQQHDHHQKRGAGKEEDASRDANQQRESASSTSILAGTDNKHLFKRSVLLIKAWCNYESRGYSGPPVSGILSEYAILTMILHTFNLYHETISFPIQALARFLATFSVWDWEKYAVTIYGAVSVPNGRKLGPRPRDASSKPLVSEDVLKFYREKYRLRFADSTTSNKDGKTASFSSASRSAKDAKTADVAAPENVPAVNISAHELRSPSSPTPLCAGVINVLDPLDSSANLTRHLTSRNVKLLQESLEYGARTLKPVLQKLRNDLEVSFRTWPHGKADSSLNKRNLIARFDSFFTNAWDRFRSGWRPDCPDTEAASSARQRLQIHGAEKSDGNAGDLELSISSVCADSFGAKQDPAVLVGAAPFASTAFSDPLGLEGGSAKLRERVEYALLLLRSEVTIPALLTLTKQILNDYWSLPVGEIGKQLQEATSNSGLSSTIKEKFGGLKRFLTGYPDIFLISTTHPFNPQVYLRSLLTKDQEDMVKNGVSVPGKQAPWTNGLSNSMSGSSSKRSSRRKKRRNGRKKGGGGSGEKATLKATAAAFVPGDKKN